MQVLVVLIEASGCCRVWAAKQRHSQGREHEKPACMCRDDVVFHDDFLTLFPKYWAAVPHNYEYIAVGMIPRHFNVSKEAVYGGVPLLFVPSIEGCFIEGCPALESCRQIVVGQS